MSQSTIPGIKAEHAIITDTCRQNRTEEGAWLEAVARLAATYDRTCHMTPVGQGMSLHLVLTVERKDEPTHD